MHRVLAVLIALVLGAGVVTAVVKDDESEPLVAPTSSPTQTFTFDGPSPTESEPTEEPTFEPGTEEPTTEPTDEPTEEPTVEPTDTLTNVQGDELPDTGTRSLAPAALMSLAIALLAGIGLTRATRRTSA